MIIWLSSYPRSGNTFLRTLLKNCLGQYTYSIYNDNDIGGDYGLTEITGHRVFEHELGSAGFNLEPLRSSKNLYFLKTHEIDRGLVDKGDKVIYIIRDGFSATFSFHKYLNEFANREVSLLELTLGLEFPGGNWSDHVSGWAPEESVDTLFLRFEEITAHPKIAIDQLALFSGLKSIKYDIPDFNELHAMNPRFFRKGNNKKFSEILTKEDEMFLGIVFSREMYKYGYTRSKLSFDTTISDYLVSVIGEGVHQYALYAKGIRNELNIHVKNLNNEVERYKSNLEISNDVLGQQLETIHQKDKELERHIDTIRQKEGLLVKHIEAINQKDRVLEQRDNAIQQRDSQITRLSSNRWYKFGQMTRRRKIWTIAKVISKNLKIDWVLRPVVNVLKEVWRALMHLLN